MKTNRIQTKLKRSASGDKDIRAEKLARDPIIACWPYIQAIVGQYVSHSSLKTRKVPTFEDTYLADAKPHITCFGRIPRHYIDCKRDLFFHRSFFYRTCRKPLHLYPCLERHGKRNARSSMSASLEKMVNLLTINNTLHADLRCTMASCISKQDLHRSPLHMRTSRVSKGVLFE
ncbi:hypothetical protein E4T56_gene20000 [Termitomyces sp. T112]|nr:hypothetical protein E4T56_gene20000 [Termitomyces sp. T112]